MKQISHERFEDGKVKYEKIAVPEYPKKINLGAQEDKCNLSCPKCLVFGTNRDPNFDILKFATSAMPMDKIIQIFDEVKGFKPIISPAYWVEPLVIQNIKEIVVEAKKRDINFYLLNTKT